MLANEWGDQLCHWALQPAIRAARAKVPGLPPGFRFHDLRHASAKTTLDTYAHVWPDSDETTRAAIDVMMAARAVALRQSSAAE